MYFTTGWPKHLQGPCFGIDSNLVSVCANRDRLLFAVITEDSISLWYCKPAVQLVHERRSAASIQRYGCNKEVLWKPDSSMLVITTTASFLLFYKVDMDVSVPNEIVLMQRDDKKTLPRKMSMSYSDAENLPALRLKNSIIAEVSGGAKTLVCLRDELIVSTGTGVLKRIQWSGQCLIDMNIQLSSVPFSIDLQHSRALQLAAADIFISHLEYSPLMGGFAAVLSDGRAAFITANSLKFEPSQVVGVWAQEITGATCSAINHKYTVMAYGTESGEGIVYNLDELTGSLRISHRLNVSSKDFPDSGSVCGAVSELKWTPDGCALAMSFQKCGFSLWSVFGALLLCSAGQNSSLSNDLSYHPPVCIQSMEWGSEGYHLWFISNQIQDKCPQDTSEDVEKSENANGVSECVHHHHHRLRLLQYSFIKSALAVNPCTPNHWHLFLQGDDRLYLSTEDVIPMWMSTSEPASNNLAMMSNKLWQVVPIPHAYLMYNWPIRFAAVNGQGHCVTVAGKTGLAHYTLTSRKWKLFGNETQERDMVVTGGLTWWKDFVCTACYNLIDQRDEIRFYPRECKLDNTFCNVVRVPSQIMLLNIFHNIMIILCADCHIMIFRLDRTPTNTVAMVSVTKLQEVAVGHFIPHPATVVSLNLTSLRTETASLKIPVQPHEAESILMNVGGRLLMFQRDRSGPQTHGNNTDSPKKKKVPTATLR